MTYVKLKTENDYKNPQTHLNIQILETPVRHARLTDRNAIEFAYVFSIAVQVHIHNVCK